MSRYVRKSRDRLMDKGLKGQFRGCPSNTLLIQGPWDVASERGVVTESRSSMTQVTRKQHSKLG